MSKNYDDGHVTWSDFEPEPEMTSDGSGDPDKHFITIWDEDGEEIAVIVHRTVGGKYPLDGDLANQKRHNAQVIVDALNENRSGHTFSWDLQ